MTSVVTKRSARLSTLAITLGSVLLSVAVQPLRAEGETVNLPAIVKAWRNRQEQVRSLDFSWSGKQYESKNKAMTGLGLGQVLGPSEAGPREGSFKCRMRFVEDAAGRARLEYDGKQWSQKDQDYIPKTVVETFDGRVHKTSFSASGVDFGSLYIGKGTTAQTARDARVLPLLIVYRPFDIALGEFDPAKLSLTAERAERDGRSYVVLKQPGRTVWVDPTRDYLPVRYDEAREGSFSYSITIDYAADDREGGVPQAWHNLVLTSKGDIFESVTARVENYKINQPIPAETFDIPIQPEMLVGDNLKGEQFILRNDGSRRVVFPDELNGSNFQQVLESEPPGTRPRWWFRILLATSVISGLLTTILIILRKRWKRLETR